MRTIIDPGSLIELRQPGDNEPAILIGAAAIAPNDEDTAEPGIYIAIRGGEKVLDMNTVSELIRMLVEFRPIVTEGLHPWRYPRQPWDERGPVQEEPPHDR